MKKLKKLKGIFSPKGASRTSCVILAGILSVPFTLFIVWITNKILGIYFDTSISQILEPRGSWTLIALIFSAPVALVVWHFRDVNTKEQIENHKQQVENQRKDINLKEFQKIAEWVSGIHFSEGNNTKEKTETVKNITSTQGIVTYNKHDGAVGLQVSSIYSLLPFYCGDYGESFKKPALSILKSAWQMLHHSDLQKLVICNAKKEEKYKRMEEDFEKIYKKEEKIIRRIKERSHNATAIALMQVLLSDEGKKLLCHPEIFSMFCFSGVNLYLFGFGQEIRNNLFCSKNLDYSGIQLQASNLQETIFSNSRFYYASFQYANLSKAKFNNTLLFSTNFQNVIAQEASFREALLSRSNLMRIDVSHSDFQGATIDNAIFYKARFEMCHFNNSFIQYSDLRRANLQDSNFEQADLSCCNMRNANLSYVNFKDSNLSETNLQGADLTMSTLLNANLERANLVGTKGITLNSLFLAKNIQRAIMEARDYYTNDDINNLRKKGIILIKGEALNTSKENIIFILRVQNKNKKGGWIEYSIYNFKVNFSETEYLNPDWLFERPNVVIS